MNRATAVVNYLVNEHKFDKNKFIIVGNGSKKPVTGCEDNQDEACRAKNRRTEFQFIWDKTIRIKGDLRRFQVKDQPTKLSLNVWILIFCKLSKQQLSSEKLSLIRY